jgi:hypothetical protein
VQQSLAIIDQPMQQVDIHKTPNTSKFHWLKICNKNQLWVDAIPIQKANPGVAMHIVALTH